MYLIKNITLILLLFSLVSCHGVKDNTEQITKEESLDRLEEKAEAALIFCKENKMNTDFCILIDMKIHSGKNRMFVWNFNTNSVEKTALCAHGVGREDKKSTYTEPQFSNIENSWLSSLGKYKVGIRSYSKWEINVHYKMHGLEETNSNAYNRYIVLHSFQPVEDDEIYPRHMRLGWSQGCPVTSNEMMTYLDSKLQKVKKPVLLWIYY